jgi:hypothetical protein
MEEEKKERNAAEIFRKNSHSQSLFGQAIVPHRSGTSSGHIVWACALPLFKQLTF